MSTSAESDVECGQCHHKSPEDATYLFIVLGEEMSCIEQAIDENAPMYGIICRKCLIAAGEDPNDYPSVATIRSTEPKEPIQ